MRETPFYSVQHSPSMAAKLRLAAGEVIDSGTYVGGEKVGEFEQKLSEYLGGGFSVGVGNGLDAITLSLMALGVSRGDEVIVPSYSFMATWIAVGRLGATCVPVDVSLETGLVRSEHVLEKVSRKTKAFLPVHLYGNPVFDPELVSCLDKKRIYTVDDSAQSLGARYPNGNVGKMGVISAYSFYPTKNLGALGDGGAIHTHDEALAEKIRALGSYGFASERHRFRYLGLNSRLDAIQAAFLSQKLTNLDSENLHRKSQRDIYAERLGNEIRMIKTGPGSTHHHIAVRVRSRDKLKALLSSKGINTDSHYPYTIERYAQLSGRRGVRKLHPSDIQSAKILADEIVTLPVGSWLSLASTEDLAKIILDSVRQTS